MSKMDLGDDSFDEFDFNAEDLQQLSSQMNIDNINSTQTHNQNNNGFSVNEDTMNSKAKRTIEELKHKLYLAESDNKQLENRLRSSEESIRLKEHDFLQLKKKYAKFTTDSMSSQPKRVFPGAPFPQIKSKYKKTNSFAREESMSIDSRSSTPFSQSQAMSMDIDIRTQSTNVKVKQELIDEPPKTLERVPSPTKSKLVKMKSNPTQDTLNSELWMILFSNIFKTQNNGKDFKSSLTSSRIKQLSDQFSTLFVPEENTCPPESIQRLKLIASEIRDILVRSIEVESTIRFLLIQWNVCLSICIENSLYNIIQTIVTLINELTATYDVIKDQFYKELLLDINQSTLYKLVKCLSLYDFRAKDPKGNRIIDDYPDIISSNCSKIKQVARKYGTFPSVIAETIHKKTKSPSGSQQAVAAILESLTRVGNHFRKPIFIFLLEDKGFLNILSADVPIELLNKAWSVMRVNFKEKNWIQNYDYSTMDNENYSCEWVTRLTDLINIQQRPHTTGNWYLVRHRMMCILKELCGVQLPKFIARWTYIKIYTRTIDLLINLCAFSTVGKRINEIKDHELLVKEGFILVYTIMKIDCPGLLEENTEYTTLKLQDLLNYYLEEIAHEQHPARYTLLSIEKILDSKMKN